MIRSEAIRVVSRHVPCPHDDLNTNLGNGKLWAKCLDCGETLAQSSIEAARDQYKRFDEALAVLSEEPKTPDPPAGSAEYLANGILMYADLLETLNVLDLDPEPYPGRRLRKQRMHVAGLVHDAREVLGKAKDGF